MSDKPTVSQETVTNLLSSALATFVFVWVVTIFWPTAIPFGLFEFWGTKRSPFEAIVGSWPLFAWGIGFTALLVFTRFNGYKESSGEIFLSGTLISIWAGVVEETCFRWLFFLSAIIGAYILDWLVLGFMGVHPVQWFYMSVLCPVADFFTFGILHDYLAGSLGWAVAAAVISSNGKFRNGHAYLGLVGIVNAWFIGMYMHYLTFNYGLVAAILVHFLYDFLIFTTVTVDARFERRRIF